MAEKKVDTLTAGRDKNLEIAISQIEKQFGKGSIMRMGDSKTALGSYTCERFLSARRSVASFS